VERNIVNEVSEVREMPFCWQSLIT